MKRWGIVEMLAAMVVLLIGFLLLKPVNTERMPSEQYQCLSNIKQIGVALTIYADDNHDHTPARGWSPELRPYQKNVEIETCPQVAKSERAYGYALNLDAAGADLTAVPLPAHEVAFFETDALGQGVVANLAARNDSRHEGASNVGYLDGHAKVIPRGRKP